MQSWQDMTTGVVQEPTSAEGGAASSGLARDIELLRCLVHPAALANGGLNVTQLAEATNRESSQVSRVMRALEHANLVERDANRNYRIGPAIFSLAARSSDDYLYRFGMTTLDTLADRIKEAVHLCTLVGTNVRTLATRTPDNFVSRVIGWEDHLVPAHSSSAGRVLLSDFTRVQLDARFADVPFDAPPGSRVHDVDSLWVEIQRIKTTGYALVGDGVADEWVGASAPVRNHTGRVVAAINVSAPASNWTDGLAEMGAVTMAAADELSKALGHVPTHPRMHLRPV